MLSCRAPGAPGGQNIVRRGARTHQCHVHDGLQVPPNDLPDRMCSTYSSRNLLIVAVTGLVAKSPRAQSTLPPISLETESNRSRSSSRPPPSWIRTSVLCSHWVPSRHGVHLPHDSMRKNSII